MKQIENKDIESARRRFIISIILLILAVIYTISPIDVIPDIIPITGLLDDIPLLLTTAANAGYSYRKLKKEQKQNEAK
ncbi:MAG: DUF1232 domain-containing protein [Spirochaetes bacterium]|nr:DUF1232 domain-containing protein [Spirochaetota bacterium]